MLLFLAVLPAAAAEKPRVAFDMPYAVPCKDVTPAAFAAAHPGQKLVEVRLQISSLLVAGQERDLTQYFIRIENRERPLEVIDYLPKTLHESRMAGPVTITDSDEKNASLGINLSGKYELFAGAGFTAGLGQKKTSCVKYDLLPPLEAVAASGTLLRSSAVFFKLKATPRHPLEGSREYGLVLRVPADWRTGGELRPAPFSGGPVPGRRRAGPARGRSLRPPAGGTRTRSRFKGQGSRSKLQVRRLDSLEL
jgi:hypothetical protein